MESLYTPALYMFGLVPMVCWPTQQANKHIIVISWTVKAVTVDKAPPFLTAHYTGVGCIFTLHRSVRRCKPLFFFVSLRVSGSSPQICTKGHQRKIFVKSYPWGQWFLFNNILLAYVVEKELGHLNVWVNMRKNLCLAFFLSHSNF